MNKKYINYLLALLVSVSLGFVSCSSDDEPIYGNDSGLVVESNNVRVLVGETFVLDILEGAGEYKAFSTNDGIASVEVVDGKLNINSFTNGNTTIIVSDNNDNYTSIEIFSYFDKISFEQEELSIKMRLGNSTTRRIPVIAGNGDYVAISDNEDIASVYSDGNYLVVLAKQVGVVNINVVDKLEVETTLTLNIETTTNAYEDVELKEIMESSESRFYYGEELEYSWGNTYKGIENGYNVYGWDYYGWEFQKVYFKGDTSVGVKEDAMFSQDYGRVKHNEVPIDFEIIKNDGYMIWAIYSFIENDILRYGYFVRPI